MSNSSSSRHGQQNVHRKDNLFGAFVVAAGVIVIAAVAWTVTRPADQPESTSTNTANTTNTTSADGVGGTDGTDEDITDESASSLTTQDSMNTNTEVNTNTTDSENTANSARLQPATYSLELLQTSTTSNEGDIVSYRFNDNDIVNVMPLEYKELVLAETPVESEVDITVGGLPATQLVIRSAKDGSEITLIQIETGEYLYDIRGDAEFLDSINTYIRFTN